MFYGFINKFMIKKINIVLLIKQKKKGFKSIIHLIISL